MQPRIPKKISILPISSQSDRISSGIHCATWRTTANFDISKPNKRIYLPNLLRRISRSTINY